MTADGEPQEGPLRLDQALVARGLAESRARARDAILRGHVSIGGRPALKPAMMVAADAELTVTDPAGGFVSRAALKLAAGLDHFGYGPRGRVALDIGASTGGFTQVLLQRGSMPSMSATGSFIRAWPPTRASSRSKG